MSYYKDFLKLLNSPYDEEETIYTDCTGKCGFCEDKNICQIPKAKAIRMVKEAAFKRELFRI